MDRLFARHFASYTTLSNRKSPIIMVNIAIAGATGGMYSITKGYM